MTDQTDLAALLHELGVGCMEPFALTRDVCVPTDPRYPMHRDLAARLHAAGVRVTGDAGLEPLDGVDCDWDESGKCRCRVTGNAGLDVERLARAISKAPFMQFAHDGWFDSPGYAATIAREYAALNRETPA